MVSTVATLQNPMQVLQKLFGDLAAIQNDLRKRLGLDPIERPKIDEAAFRHGHLASEDLDKYFDSLLRAALSDANKIAAKAREHPEGAEQLGKSLEEFHELFSEAMRVYRDHMRRAHFFYQFAQKLDRMTGRLIRGNKGLEAQHRKKVRQEEAKRRKAEGEVKRQQQKLRAEQRNEANIIRLRRADKRAA